MRVTALLILAASAFAAAPAMAQTPAVEGTLKACSSQQDLEQVIQSEGRITPDGCWDMTVNSLEAEGVRLCLLQLSPNNDSVLGKIQDLAAPSEWWVRCDQLVDGANRF